MNKIQL